MCVHFEPALLLQHHSRSLAENAMEMKGVGIARFIHTLGEIETWVNVPHPNAL